MTETSLKYEANQYKWRIKDTEYEQWRHLSESPFMTSWYIDRTVCIAIQLQLDDVVKDEIQRESRTTSPT